jgi:DNA repair protein RadC
VVDPKLRRIADAVRDDPSLLDRLLALAEPPPSASARTPAEVFGLVAPLLVGRATEALVAIGLNRRGRVLGVEVLTTGSDGFTVVDARQVFRWALRQGRSGASSVILAHNHPSGDPVPSAQDVDVTRRIVAAGKVIGIGVLDHLVVTDETYTSMSERGQL